MYSSGRGSLSIIRKHILGGGSQSPVRAGKQDSLERGAEGVERKIRGIDIAKAMLEGRESRGT